MWIDYWNGDIARYNNVAGMYASAYDKFAKEYHKVHMPKQEKVKYFGTPKLGG